MPHDVPHSWTSFTAIKAAGGAPASPKAANPRPAERLVAIDHPDQRVMPGTAAACPLFLRVDDTHELPLVLYNARGDIVARFADGFEAGLYLQARDTVTRTGLPRVTLPQPIAEAYARWRDEMAGLVPRLREGGAL